MLSGKETHSDLKKFRFETTDTHNKTTNISCHVYYCRSSVSTLLLFFLLLTFLARLRLLRRRPLLRRGRALQPLLQPVR